MLEDLHKPTESVNRTELRQTSKERQAVSKEEAGTRKNETHAYTLTKVNVRDLPVECFIDRSWDAGASWGLSPTPRPAS